MLEPNFEQIAYKIVNICARVRNGDMVLIMGRADTLNYNETIALHCRKIGAHPLIIVNTDEYFIRSIKEVPIEFLLETPRHLLNLIESSDVIITTAFEKRNPAILTNISEEKLGAIRIAYKPINNVLYDGKRKWLGTDFPTPEQAQMLKVDFEEFHDMYWKAIDIDYKDLYIHAQLLAEKFENADKVQILSDKGTDLKFSIKNRRISKDDGIIDINDMRIGAPFLNLPSGEICTAPIENSAFGKAVFDVVFIKGKKVEDLILEFENGLCYPIEAKKGFEIFRDLLKNTHGDNRRIAELGIGLNPAITKPIGYTLTDEKILGTVHIAIGDNKMLGGNNSSDLHLDMIILEPTLLLDNKIIIDKGKLLY